MSQNLIAELGALEKDFINLIGPIKDEPEIRRVQAQYLGKKGKVTAIMKSMGALNPDERKEVGAAFNQVKLKITDAVDEKLLAIVNEKKAEDLKRVVDMTLPGRESPMGHVHLITQIQEEAVDIFAELGFEMTEGPQIETDFHNFEALGFDENHPARDEQDTFFVENGKLLLRTQTSTVQVRTMRSTKPPVKIISPGVVYRRDDDPTHSPMFTQIEGLLVDTDPVRFTDLKGVLWHFVHRYFGEGLDIRFRPSFFPFVEPGAEVDMQCSFCKTGVSTCRVCKGTGWVEIGGAGMVDPVVFEHVGYDPKEVTGFAFGMGLERMAMLRHGVSDIKYYYEGDLRFLTQF